MIIKQIMEGPHHVKIIFEGRELNNPQEKLVWEKGKDYHYEIKLYTNGERSWYALNLLSEKTWSEKQLRKKGEDSLSINEIKMAEVKADSILKANLPVPIIEKPKDTNLIKTDTALTPMATNDFNCNNPVHPKGFVLLIQQVELQPDDQTRLEKSKKLVKENCLSSIQIMELIQLMHFEVSKLELATFAYPFCFDPKNYSFVEDAFEYESSIRELHNKIYAEK